MEKPPQAGPVGPGPFSMADKDATEELFTRAGFVDVEFDSIEAPFVFEGDGSAAATRVLSAGPLGARFLAADDALRHEVISQVVEALKHYRTASGFEVPAASWCITARRP